MWRVLARAGVRDADLKDGLQEVFIIAANKLDQLEEGVRPTTWLYGIAVRVAANQRRKHQRKREELADDVGEALPDDPNASPEELAARAEASALLTRLLDELSPDQRIVFEMFELEEMTCPAIAEKLAIPLGTVYTRLRAARASITERAAAASTRGEEAAT